MRSLFLSLVSAALFFTIAGCGKDANLCEGMLSQTPPPTVGLVVLDQTDGKNFILKNALDADDIKVSDEKTGKTLQNWRIIVGPGDHPLYGALELPVFDRTEGDHTLNIQINGIGPILLSYSISKEKNNSTCQPYYYPVTALRVSNHAWEVFEHNGKPIPEIVVVRISKK